MTDTALTFGPRAVPLSVLDPAPAPGGGGAGEALRAPPVLIGHIADATTTLRAGSGGVMLPAS